MSSKSTFSNSTSKSYALALYELSKENSELDEVESGIKVLNEILKKNSDFKDMIYSPTIPKDNKKDVIFAIAEQNNFSEILKKFLGYLIKILHLYFFLNLVIGARTGPRILTSFIFGSFDLILEANFIIIFSLLPEIIRDIRR